MPNKSDFISRSRQNVNDLIDVVNQLTECLTERSRLDYTDLLEDADFAGQEDVTAADFNAGLDVIGSVLSGITEEQKRAIYKLKT
jgi:putative N-acetylmannosamine-6-phosphate epimerase